MRKALLATVLVAALGVTSMALAGSGGGTPALRVTKMRPLQVSGAGFKPGERVSVTVLVSFKKWRKPAVATAAGRFSAVFRGAGVDQCTSFVVSARGDRGSRAHVRNRALADCPDVDLGNGLGEGGGVAR